MSDNQKREPKGASNGGQFAADVNPESTVVLAPTAPRDETARLQSDEYLERFAEEANDHLDNWLDAKADADEDWNEWTLADALTFMENLESLIRNRKNALLEDVRKAEMKKIAGAG